MIQKRISEGGAVREPTFLILGAAKAGTTTLYNVLNEHPDITLSRPKEPLFFETEFEQGLEYYWQSYFAHWNGQSAIGEARAAKLFLPYVASRIKASLPTVKLIAVLRNPVDRIFSHWWMRYCNGKEKLTLKAALAKNLEAIRQGRTLEGESGQRNWLAYLDLQPGTSPFYLEIGYYAQQIQTYLELFPPSRLKIMFFDDLGRDPGKFLAEVLNFLEVSTDVPLPAMVKHNAAPTRTALTLHKVDRYFNLPKYVPASVRSRIKSFAAALGNAPGMDHETRRMLAAHYLPHNRRLEEITQRDLSHWDHVDG